jgi:hypothetical protein
MVIKIAIQLKLSYRFNLRAIRVSSHVAHAYHMLFAHFVAHHSRVQWSCVSRVLFHTWWRADSRVIRVVTRRSHISLVVRVQY